MSWRPSNPSCCRFKLTLERRKEGGGSVASKIGAFSVVRERTVAWRKGRYGPKIKISKVNGDE